MSNNKRVLEGTHPFLEKNFQKNVQLKNIENGTHHFLNSKIQSENAIKGNTSRLKNGTHPSQIKKVCPYCNKILDSANFGRYHGNKCKEKREK